MFFADNPFLAIHALGIEALSFDSRQTLLWPDYPRIIAIALAHNLVVDEKSLKTSLCFAHWTAEKQRASQPISLTSSHCLFPAHWGDCVHMWLKGALHALDPALDREVPDELIAALWQEHRERDLWSVPDKQALKALALLKRKGLQLAIVASSENGDLLETLHATGLDAFFEERLVLDAHDEGVPKGPELFVRLCDRLGVDASRIIHVGNQPTEDAWSAREAGLRTALYDPLNMWKEERLPQDIHRVNSLVYFATCLPTIRRHSSDPPRRTSSNPSPA